MRDNAFTLLTVMPLLALTLRTQERACLGFGFEVWVWNLEFGV